MKTKSNSILTIVAVLGFILQGAGLLFAMWAFDPLRSFPMPVERDVPIAMELNFIFSALTFLLGTIFVMFPLETHLIKTGRKTGFSRLSFLGPIGILLFLKLQNNFIKPKPVDAVAPSKGRRSEKKGQTTGFVFTLLISLVFIWAGYLWINRDQAFRPPSSSTIRRNEIRAFRRLAQICDAQNQYILKDWDNDGEKRYADFLVHLWTTIDENANPLSANLIPKELAFAMRRPYALDGYFYVDLRGKNAVVRQNEINYKAEFYTGAFPVSVKKNDSLSFIINHKREIFAKRLDSIKPDSTIGLFAVPSNLLKEGWIRIHNEDEIQKLPRDSNSGKNR